MAFVRTLTDKNNVSYDIKSLEMYGTMVTSSDAISSLGSASNGVRKYHFDSTSKPTGLPSDFGDRGGMIVIENGKDASQKEIFLYAYNVDTNYWHCRNVSPSGMTDWKTCYYTPADDSTVVKTSGNQTIAGTKTFSSTITGNVSGSSGSCTGNAATATSAGKWTTARNISISDADGTNTGSAVSVNGSANATLKLPATIKASITGNCSGSSGSCTGNAATATSATSAGSAGYTTKLQYNSSDVEDWNTPGTASMVTYDQVANGSSHNPYYGIGYGITGMHPGSTSYGFQQAFMTQAGRAYWRLKSDNAWGSWHDMDAAIRDGDGNTISTTYVKSAQVCNVTTYSGTVTGVTLTDINTYYQVGQFFTVPAHGSITERLSLRNTGETSWWQTHAPVFTFCLSTSHPSQVTPLKARAFNCHEIVTNYSTTAGIAYSWSECDGFISWSNPTPTDTVVRLYISSTQPLYGWGELEQEATIYSNVTIYA